MSIKGADKDHDFRVEKKQDGSYEVTDVEGGKSHTFKTGAFDLEYGALLRFDLNGS